MIKNSQIWEMLKQPNEMVMYCINVNTSFFWCLCRDIPLCKECLLTGVLRSKHQFL